MLDEAVQIGWSFFHMLGNLTRSMNITIRVIVIFVLRVLGAFCHHAPTVSCACRDGDRFLLKGRLMLLTWLLNSASGLQHLLRNAILWSGVLHANALSWQNRPAAFVLQRTGIKRPSACAVIMYGCACKPFRYGSHGWCVAWMLRAAIQPRCTISLTAQS